MSDIVERPKKTGRGAVLQMEIDVARWTDTKGVSFHGGLNDTPWERIYNIAKTAACDTIKNGGTFVLVVEVGKKITMVQRPDAEDL